MGFFIGLVLVSCIFFWRLRYGDCVDKKVIMRKGECEGNYLVKLVIVMMRKVIFNRFVKIIL